MSLFKRQSLTTPQHLPLFTQLSDEMNRFFEGDISNLDRRMDVLGSQWVPDVDVKQEDKRYVVKADMPGINAKDIKVAMDSGVLTIQGKRVNEVEDNRENYRCIERNYGAFFRSIQLADAAETKNISAHCHNGVLEIIIPKTLSPHKTIPVISD